MPGIAYKPIDLRYAICVHSGMNVASYIKSGKTTAADLARALSCSPSHVYDMARGRRSPSKKLALKLEKLTGQPWWKWMERA